MTPSPTIAANSPPGASAPARLVSSLPDDPSFRPIIVEFVEHLQRKLALMEDAAARCDTAALAALGHWLKGTGPTLGFAPLGTAGAELERPARAGQSADYGGLVAAIRSLAEMIELPAVPEGAPVR